MSNKDRLISIYRPDVFESGSQANLEDLRFLDQSIPFSFGRDCLRNLVIEILKSKKSSLKVLLPEFICRDVFDGIKDLNAKITWYKIDLYDLSRVSIEKEKLESHDLLIVVNYFGVAAHFEKEDSYKNLIVIEDNAHGFLSEDSKGKKLGTRFDFGIFSLRKTLPVTMGAALCFSDMHSQIIKNLKKSQEEKRLVDIGISKLKVRNLLSFIPLRFFLVLLKLKRGFSKSTNNEMEAEPEENIFFPKNLLSRLNVQKEKDRRIRLYAYCKKLLEEMAPWIDIIPFKEGEIPYGFVFILREPTKLESIRSAVENKGADLVNWPDLPEDVLIRYPGDCIYKQVYFIPFNW